MRLKPNWKEYLHAIRAREVSMALAAAGKEHFARGVEFGAGDGYQTTLLAPHCDSYVSSDLNFKRFKESLKLPGVTYIVCDADAPMAFPDGEFDLVFSSSMLEHLSNPEGFVRETHRILRGNGTAIHIVPSRFLKILYLVLFYPNLLVVALERLVGLQRGEKLFRGEGGVSHENNLNAPAAAGAGRWRRLLVPQVHGNFSSHTAEYRGFGRRRWEALFQEGGFSIRACARGPVFSGYGFGWGGARAFFERAGFCSEYIFILQRS